MLFDQIRYAEKVRTFYRLRGRPGRKIASSVVEGLGYSRYSRRFYEVKKWLKEDGVLDGRGRFVENTPNTWLAELPLAADKAQREVLGDRVPFTVFLAVVLGSRRRLGDLARTLNLNRSSVYHATSRLIKAGLLQRKDAEVSIAGSAAEEWLLKYLDACKTHVDVTGDISMLFRAVPAYIDGPRAYYALHHEVGMPIGRADMVISTREPFIGFWTSVVSDVRYFREYQKDVRVAVATPSAKVVWVDRLPFNAKAKRPGG